MVFCVVALMRAYVTHLLVPPFSRPGGSFNRLGYMDDTRWCIDSESDPPLFADNLQWVGLCADLFYSGPKQSPLVALCEGFQVRFHPALVYMGRSRMPVHQRSGYMRIVG